VSFVLCPVPVIGVETWWKLKVLGARCHSTMSISLSHLKGCRLDCDSNCVRSSRSKSSQKGGMTCFSFITSEFHELYLKISELLLRNCWAIRVDCVAKLFAECLWHVVCCTSRSDNENICGLVANPVVTLFEPVRVLRRIFSSEGDVGVTSEQWLASQWLLSITYY
jgi:hypothetical protein